MKSAGKSKPCSTSIKAAGNRFANVAAGASDNTTGNSVRSLTNSAIWGSQNNAVAY